MKKKIRLYKIGFLMMLGCIKIGFMIGFRIFKFFITDSKKNG